MPMEMQARLLRVLQERVVQRLGSTRNIPLHARVIATSHRIWRRRSQLVRSGSTSSTG